MKQYGALLLSIVMLLVAFTACAPEGSPPKTSTINYFTTTVPQTTTLKSMGIGIGYLGLEEMELEYTGEPVELILDVNPQDNEVVMVLLVDGFMQPYSVDGGEMDYFHKVSGGMYTLRFHPVSGRSGETVQLVSRVVKQPDLDNPENQSLDELDYFLLLNEHQMKSHCAIDIKMKVDAPTTSPEVASGLAYVQDIEKMFSYQGVAIEDMHWTDFRIYDIVLTPEQDMDNPGRINSIFAQENTEHEVFICGYGKTGKYRVMLFINNELQNVFDGKAYLDMEIEENKQTTCSLKINTEGLNKNNYIYLVYCPIDLETNEISYHASKTFTSLLLVE